MTFVGLVASLLLTSIVVATVAAENGSVSATTTTTSSADLNLPNVTLTHLTFGSCHKRKYQVPGLWQRVKEQNSQAWLWMGDAVYPTQRGIAPVQALVDEYQQLRHENAEYAGLVQSSTTEQQPYYIWGTWDDHDYGGNDMGKDMPDRTARRNAFWDFMDYAHAPRDDDNDPRQGGVYHSVTLGQAPQQVKIIFLDTRSFRDDHCLIPSVATKFPLGAGVACATRWAVAGLAHWYCRNKNKEATMLGTEQWTWLQQQLAESTAAVHIIVSSVQVLSTNPVMEGWCHFPSERTRLLRLLRHVPGAVLLSGDVHYAEILNASTRLVTEVTSSGLTHVCTKHIYGPLCQPLLQTFSAHRLNRTNGYYIGRNFGSLMIDWASQTVEVKIHDALSGDTVLTTGPMAIVGRTPSPVMSDEDLEQIPTCMDGHLLPVAVAVMSSVVVLFLVWRRK